MTMQYKKWLALSVAGAGLVVGAQSAMARPFDKDDFTREELASVKITMEEAVAKARKLHGGTPIKAKMEHEDRTILYEVELLDGADREKEVYINAVTGEVIQDD